MHILSIANGTYFFEVQLCIEMLISKEKHVFPILTILCLGTSLLCVVWVAPIWIAWSIDTPCCNSKLDGTVHLRIHLQEILWLVRCKAGPS